MELNPNLPSSKVINFIIKLTMKKMPLRRRENLFQYLDKTTKMINTSCIKQSLLKSPNAKRKAQTNR